MEEKFVVVSLAENKSRDIAKILSNESSRKILDALSENRMTITELSEKLKVPMPTVQYNIDLLKEAGFVKQSAFRYSEKGRKIVYYEPEKKIIILAPKGQEKSIFEKLKFFVFPIVLAIGALVAGTVSLIGTGSFSSASSKVAANTLLASAPVAEVSAGASVAVVNSAPVSNMIACVSPLTILIAFIAGILLGAAIVSFIWALTKFGKWLIS